VVEGGGGGWGLFRGASLMRSKNGRDQNKSEKMADRASKQVSSYSMVSMVGFNEPNLTILSS
jgi:hypothetical protein